MNDDRAAWLAARRSGIGGSDIAAIVGLSPWRSPLDVFLDKTGQLPEQEQNVEAMYWGSTLEDVVAREYAKRTNRRIHRVNQLLRHPQRDWQLGNIDRAVVNPDIAGRVFIRGGRLTTNRLLECKTGSAYVKDAWGEAGTDQIATHYIPQTQWYMDIAGAAFCDVAVLLGGNDFRVYTVARDDDLIASLVAAAEEFWSNLQQGIAPAPRSEADARRLWPRNQAGKQVFVGADVAAACAELNRVAAQAKALEARQDELRTVVMAALGDADEAICDGRKVASWKCNKDSRRTDWQRVADALSPHVATDVLDAAVAACTETKPGARVLRIAADKEQPA